MGKTRECSFCGKEMLKKNLMRHQGHQDEELLHCPAAGCHYITSRSRDLQRHQEGRGSPSYSSSKASDHFQPMDQGAVSERSMSPAHHFQVEVPLTTTEHTRRVLDPPGIQGPRLETSTRVVEVGEEMAQRDLLGRSWKRQHLTFPTCQHSTPLQTRMLMRTHGQFFWAIPLCPDRLRRRLLTF